MLGRQMVAYVCDRSGYEDANVDVGVVYYDLGLARTRFPVPEKREVALRLLLSSI